MSAPRKKQTSARPQFRIYCGENIALGPGKVELLNHIAQTGSIAEAARRMEMSYNRAWLLVRTMNRCFKEPLIEATRGGKTRGGAQLTPLGRQMTKLYAELEAKTLAATQETLKKIMARLKH